ncbi:MAG: (d)CMP kinase [Betaproteobacteria bacterium]|nr:(d)CMP kinase [Betaproteobacteria bacterium]
MPVIAIDGPSASGKGTVAAAVAAHLDFHYLDSGALYRLVAKAALDRGVLLNDEPKIAKIAVNLAVRFSGTSIYLDGEDVTDAIRTESISAGSSIVAAQPAVRAALLARQRAFRSLPGLVADGRDMESIVFPDAVLKVFLTASAETRAERRYKQLIGKGISDNIPRLLQELRDRDERDCNRASAPLIQLPDARLLDTTNLTVAEAIAQVLRWVEPVIPRPSMGA